jgi:hypothetical protein
LSLLGALPVYAACTQAAPASTSQDESDLQIEFSQMYSGFDGVHTFSLPAKVDGAKNIKWSASPAGIVSFSKGDSASETLITVTNAPTDSQTTVTITAKVGSLSAKAPLVISGTTPDVWQQGESRYKDGVVFSWGGDQDGGGGGFGGPPPDGGERHHAPPDPHLACTNCHDQGKGDGHDVEHTPTQTGGYSDDDLKNIITQATKPTCDDSTDDNCENGHIKQRIMPLEQWQQIHKWAMDDQQLAGIIVYLRSLEPKSQGSVDFPGPHGGGGHHGSSSGGSSSKGSSSPSSSSSSSPN